MAYLPNVNMLPTSAIVQAWCLVIVILSLFANENKSNAQAWTTDIQPTLKIKYGMLFPKVYFLWILLYVYTFLFTSQIMIH